MSDLVPSNVAATVDAMLALPAVKEATGSEKQPAFIKTPWLSFFGEKTNSGRDELRENKIAINSFYLRDIVPVKVDPCQITLLQGYFCFVDWDKEVKMAVKASPAKVKGEIETEHAVGIVAVKIDGGYTVALYEHNRGLADPFFKLQNVVRGVERDKNGVQWGSKGKAFKEGFAAAGGLGKLAVGAILTGEAIKAKDNKGKDNNVFYKGDVRIVANDAGEVKALLDYLRSDDGAARLSAAAGTFARKVNYLEGLIKGQPAGEEQEVHDDIEA